jgi:hypothetical protein
MHIMETTWALIGIIASYVPCNAIGFAFWSVYDVGPGNVSGTYQANFINAVMDSYSSFQPSVSFNYFFPPTFKCVMSLFGLCEHPHGQWPLYLTAALFTLCSRSSPFHAITSLVILLITATTLLAE